MKKQNPFGQLPLFPADTRDWVSDYDVIWLSPSAVSRDSMPYGNGDTGLNVYGD